MGNIGLAGDSTKRLHIDRKMVGILSVFTILGLCLVIALLIATNTLSALRGFASLQTHWTEARKEATLQLDSYLQTSREQYYTRFDSAVGYIRKAREIRRSLSEGSPDYKQIRSNFLDLHVIPEDVDLMIKAFERFHEFSDFEEALKQWAISDQLVQEMVGLAVTSRQQMQAGTFKVLDKGKAIERLSHLDKQLTEVQYRLAEALSRGTRFLNSVILWVALSIGFILLATGGFLSLRFLKSLRQWRRTIELNEQKYRSLFEQNPNAVYAISKDGQILHGNEGLEKLTGYSIDELKEISFSCLFDKSEVNKVDRAFRKAVAGVPQTYETTATTKDGKQIFAEVTNLPIYVDGEIIGVYGIAQSITERKKKEQKIKEQLVEKTHLLSEVHDRVKNNLTLIISLLQIQRDEVQEQEKRNYLEPTIARIHAIAMVHERLYQNDKFSSIRFDKYLRQYRESTEMLSHSVSLDTDPVTLGIKQAIPSALLLNELMTNVCKNDNKREIALRVTQKDDDIILKLSSAGGGLPNEYDIEEASTLSLRLVKALLLQLQASCKVDQKKSATIEISFKNNSGISE